MVLEMLSYFKIGVVLVKTIIARRQKLLSIQFGAHNVELLKSDQFQSLMKTVSGINQCGGNH